MVTSLRRKYSTPRRRATTARGGVGMEVIIKGEVKEIAALLLQIEGRQIESKEVDLNKLSQNLYNVMRSRGDWNA